MSLPFTPVDFALPGMLFLLLPWLVLSVVVLRRFCKPEVRFTGWSPGHSPFRNTWKTRIYRGLDGLRLGALGLLIVGLARPRSEDLNVERQSKTGVDIAIALDVSASMLSRDFKPNRLEASKAVVQRFIEGRPTDRIGLVAFAGESYTACPLTTDHRLLIDALGRLDFGKITDGTAIGMGLANAVNRLRNTQGESKIAVLVTDGVNNQGAIDPETALVLAKETGLKVYTIGVGTTGMAPSPYAYAPGGGLLYRMAPVEIDEDLLKRIAQATGGRYFRATDNASLDEIYREIDRLEKIEVEETRYLNYREHYRGWVWAASILLMLDVLLRLTWFKSALS
ncbi:VWA domain-containing protein [bacterium]|nr:VWA domain-containing protein [bacterium]